MIQAVATFLAGTFFGAALYINLAQHPATVKLGGAFAKDFFPPMYHAASTMQIVLAVGGTLLGLVEWYLTDQTLWLVGALLLVSVIPITLVFIKPINDQLLEPNNDLGPDQVLALLKQWNPRHWVRSIVSGLAFAIYLVAMGIAGTA